MEAFVLDLLKVGGLPGLMAYLWYKDRQSTSTTLDHLGDAVQELALQVGTLAGNCAAVTEQRDRKKG